MHFDFRKDAPLTGCYDEFMKKELLIAHRDTFMGELAARLAVLSDGLEEVPLVSLCRSRRRYRKGIRAGLCAAAADYYAHTVFFGCLYSGDGENYPRGKTAAMLEKSFGSVENFCYRFRHAASEAAPGGFLWLCEEKHRGSGALHLIYTPGGKIPREGERPLAALDLWEHAYVSAFGTDVSSYAARFLAFIDWGRIVI